MAKVIIVDTNIALHYERIDQIDWLTIAGAKQCAIAIVPTLLRELEHQKVHNKSEVLRNRAAKVISYLVGLMDRPDPVEIRAGVTAMFVSAEPQLDFPSVQLRESINDDFYIAHALELARQGHEVAIASDDGGMALKLRGRSIGLVKPPSEQMLKGEVDPAQKEIRELKRKNARLEARVPSLVVRGRNGAKLLRLELSGPDKFALTPPEQIYADYPELPVPGTLPVKPEEMAAPFDLGNLHSPAMAIEIYNHNIMEFHHDYGRYYAEMRAAYEVIRATRVIKLSLVNEGSAPATNVDVAIVAPAGVLVRKAGDLPKSPKEPKPPRHPSEPSRLTVDHLYMPPPAPMLPSLDLQIHDGAARVIPKKGLVEFSVRTLKQKLSLDLDVFWVTFASPESCKAFELAVTITCNEGDPVEHSLPVVFNSPEKSED